MYLLKYYKNSYLSYFNVDPVSRTINKKVLKFE